MRNSFLGLHLMETANCWDYVAILSSHFSDSESDIPLDMGVASSPLQADSTRADSPSQEMVSSSQMTPPTKPNKVGEHGSNSSPFSPLR